MASSTATRATDSLTPAFSASSMLCSGTTFRRIELEASETHIAFWELFPTVDHFLPVSRGGGDDESNWVTTSMLTNQAKGHWTVEELGWVHPAGTVEEWDGLSRWLVEYLAAPSIVLEGAAEPHRGYIRRWLPSPRRR